MVPQSKHVLIRSYDKWVYDGVEAYTINERYKIPLRGHYRIKYTIIWPLPTVKKVVCKNGKVYVDGFKIVIPGEYDDGAYEIGENIQTIEYLNKRIYGPFGAVEAVVEKIEPRIWPYDDFIRVTVEQGLVLITTPAGRICVDRRDDWPDGTYKMVDNYAVRING